MSFILASASLSFFFSFCHFLSCSFGHLVERQKDQRAQTNVQLHCYHLRSVTIHIFWNSLHSLLLRLQQSSAPVSWILDSLGSRCCHRLMITLPPTSLPIAGHPLRTTFLHPMVRIMEKSSLSTKETKVWFRRPLHPSASSRTKCSPMP